MRCQRRARSPRDSWTRCCCPRSAELIGYFDSGFFFTLKSKRNAFSHLFCKRARAHGFFFREVEVEKKKKMAKQITFSLSPAVDHSLRERQRVFFFTRAVSLSLCLSLEGPSTNMASREVGGAGEGEHDLPPPPPSSGVSNAAGGIAATADAPNENNKRPAEGAAAAPAAALGGQACETGEPPRRRARKSRWEEAPDPSTLSPPPPPMPPPPMPPPTFSSLPPGALPHLPPPPPPPQRTGQVSMPHVSAAATSALTLAAASGARELTLPGGIKVQLPVAVVGGPAQKSDDPAVLALYDELADTERRLREDDLDIPPSPQRSPSPEPVYDRTGVRLNTREVRAREKLSEKRQDLIEELIKSDRSYRPPHDYRPQKKRKKLYIPQKKYPNFNFIGLVIGPRGKTQRELQAQTGCRVVIRGRGAMKEGAARAPGHDYGEDDDLHVLIEGKNG